MGLTLSIIEHELEAIGRVERSIDENPSFLGARVFLEARALNEDMLYLCAHPNEVRAVHEAGCHALFVSADDGAAVPCATLSLFSDESPLSVLDVLLDCFQRYDAWERRMDRVFYDQGTLQDLLDASEPFLVNNVVVLDPALKLLAYTRSVPCDDPITMELINHGYHTEDNIRKFKLHRRFKPWAECDGFVVNDTKTICKYVTVVKSFKGKQAFSLIAVMMCNVAAPEQHLLDAYQMFADRVSRFAERDYPDDKPSGNAVDTFLKDLICGHVSDDEVVDRCRYVGIPHDARFCLFYLKPGRESVPGSRLLADVSLVVAPAKTILVDDAVVVLCFNCSSAVCALHCRAQACPRKGRTISQRLNEMLSRYELTSGRSSMFTSLSNAPVAYAQAKEAHAIGVRRSNREADPNALNAWDRIYSFDAYGIDYVVGQVSDEGVALLDSTYVGSLLGEIERQDEIAKTNNYEFLYEYLLNERRVTVVAERLHMHRNNVAYRIGRIEQQYGIDVDDPVLRQDLLVAFRVRQAIVRNA